ncbi:MAG: tyrosine-type recombinase/integrase [Chloroflexota bacterium]
MPSLKLVKSPTAAMAQSVEDYLLACRSRGVKPSTIRDAYGYPLRSVFLPWCEQAGVASPAAVDARTLERFASELRERRQRDGRPLSENTVWTYLKSTNQYLAWAAGEVEGGTAARVKLRKPPGRKVDVLERDQIKALERAALTERDKVIIRLLADTGLRPGELASIHGGDLRRSGRRHYVRVRGKTGEREVGVTTEMYGRLRGISRGEDDPVFVGLRKDRRTGEREPLTVNGVRQMIRDLALDAGVRTNVTPYTFRHSACRWMLLSGMATVEVAAILGHGSEAMIRDHYANIGREDSHDKLMSLLRAER